MLSYRMEWLPTISIRSVLRSKTFWPNPTHFLSHPKVGPASKMTKNGCLLSVNYGCVLHSWKAQGKEILRRSLSYRNQPIDSESKSVDWFLHDMDLRHERVKPKYYFTSSLILSIYLKVSECCNFLCNSIIFILEVEVLTNQTPSSCIVLL